ncbi:hypothetical protein MBLNU230_g1211t1 [Neophaeotheca triangularis]
MLVGAVVAGCEEKCFPDYRRLAKISVNSVCINKCTDQDLTTREVPPAEVDQLNVCNKSMEYRPRPGKQRRSPPPPPRPRSVVWDSWSLD